MVGADAALIWFGVMLCVNMQTSFMHPPFGFALFYLRSVAPKEVKSSDIYWGAIPWVLLQLIMVAIVIFVPRTGDLLPRQADAASIPSKVKIEIQAPPSGRRGAAGLQVDRRLSSVETQKSPAVAGGAFPLWRFGFSGPGPTSRS